MTNGTDYATIAALLAADDLPQRTMPIWGLRILVRALTLEERENARARALRPNGTLDMLVFYRECIRQGVVAPPMNDEQAAAFCQKHAGTVQDVADLIYKLSELNYARIEGIARSVAGVEPNGDTDTTAAVPEPAAV